VDLGIQITYLPNGRLEVVTASPDAMEGNRPSFVVRGETHLWTPNSTGHRMRDVISRNLGKTNGRGLSLTNSHEPGMRSVAEIDYEAWEQMAAGNTVASDLLYDSLEAPPETKLDDPDSLVVGLDAARGDSLWVPIDRLSQEIIDPRTPTSMSRRFYLNQLHAAQDALFDIREWNACERPPEGCDVAPGTPVTLFFDGSRSDDHTALVGCRIEDGMVFVVGHWNPAEHGGEIPRREVDAVVAQAFDRYHVVALWADVRLWESYIDSWAERYGRELLLWAGPKSGKKAHPIAFDMRGRTKEFTPAVERFVVDVVSGDMSHNGDARLAQHVGNARRAVNQYGFSVRKESPDSSKKIDLAVCAIGARMTRQIILSSNMAYKKKAYSSFAF
jgi:phage terminase large subunit-like protein